MSPAKWFERIRKDVLKANPYWRKKGGQGGVREAQLRPEKYRNYSLRPNSMMLLIRYSWQNVLIAQIANLTMLTHSYSVRPCTQGNITFFFVVLHLCSLLLTSFCWESPCPQCCPHVPTQEQASWVCQCHAGLVSPCQLNHNCWVSFFFSLYIYITFSLFLFWLALLRFAWLLHLDILTSHMKYILLPLWYFWYLLKGLTS